MKAANWFQFAGLAKINLTLQCRLAESLPSAILRNYYKNFIHNNGIFEKYRKYGIA
jgi:hypothetical protein